MKGLLALAAGAAVYAVAIEPLWLQVRRTRIPIPHLPPSLDGLRVGLLSDLHAGIWARPDLFERAVAALQDVDVAILAGDVVGARAREGWEPDLEPLRNLRARLGRFAILGGHDHRRDAEGVHRRLESLGWHVLRNEKVDLGGLWLVGLDDNSQLPRHDDLNAACNGLPSGAPAILAAHSPDAIEDARARGLSLVVSGHTHGGQIRLPWFGSIVTVTDLDKRYDDGLSRHGATWLYVSRGVGSTYRLRFLCRPDVSILTLSQA